MNKIFVNISSYRDEELIPTVRNAIEKAKDKSRISFGICWQHGPDEPKTFGEEDDPLFEGIAGLNYARYDYRDSKGMGWARKISQSFLRDEAWQLQIDSHMRFAQDWDWHLLNLLARCKSKKPILTSRTLPYYPDQNDKLREGLSTYMHPKNFRDNGVLVLTSGAFRKREKLKNPVPGAFISGHYMFSSSRIIHEMPYDEKFAIISTGDEPALAIKAFTRGYDIFYPHKVVVWHHFYREGAKKNHAEDSHKKKGVVHEGVNALAKEGVKRFVELTNGKIKDSRYGLGKERTLLDYKKYSGVDYKNRKLDKDRVRVDGVFKKESDKSATSKSTPEPQKRPQISIPQDGKDKIFVQIASYRDPDIENTIEAAIKMAEKPENLIFGICDQYGPENKHLSLYDKDNFRVVRVPFYFSKGLGWARATIQQLYFDDAEYTMQLDAHMRFKPFWDKKLIQMVKDAPSEKPIISHYCTAFTFNQEEQKIVTRDDLFKMYCLRFNDTGTVSFRQSRVNKEDKGKLGRSMLVSGHFYFTLGKHIREYTYDPDLYFAGDEISLATRSWTRGWDIFHPSEGVVFHNYTREQRVCHWSDQKVSYGKLHKESLSRLGDMLGIGKGGKGLIGKMGLGAERSLEDYQRISGINFKDKVLEDHAKEGNPIF
tara:strand:+ start:332 stop:2293 length:1962 start_codon:yes stop_codon:yes gene_type:complete